MPATRLWVRACAETSIATARTLFSFIRAMSACNSLASGVVSLDTNVSSAMCRSAVEESPVTTPSCRRIASSKYTVDVLPFVPVTPTNTGGLESVLNNQFATTPKTARGESTTTSGTPELDAISAPSRSVRTATAPRSIASETNSAPCRRAPRTATNKSPG